MLDFSDNYFQIFDLPVSCDIDLKLLSQRYKNVLMQAHPDRQTDITRKNKAIQLASYINNAYNTLKNLDNRAIYLLKLSGCEVNLEHESIDDTDFLAEQLSLREQIADAKSSEDLQLVSDKINKKIREDIDQTYEKFSENWLTASKESLLRAKQLAYKLKFMIRAQAELEKLATTMLN